MSKFGVIVRNSKSFQLASELCAAIPLDFLNMRYKPITQYQDSGGVKQTIENPTEIFCWYDSCDKNIPDDQKIELAKKLKCDKLIYKETK